MDNRLSAIFARRSVREYTTEEVSDEDLRALLEAAMAAPSGNNRQPWQFVVVKDRALLDRLAEVHPYARMLARAPLGFAVCGEPSTSRWWVQDCSAATENLLVAAATIGLGAVWIGCHGVTEREEAVARTLGIPESVAVFCLISVGHPAEGPQARTQYRDEKVHTNRW